jgi:hypothetical protein
MTAIAFAALAVLALVAFAAILIVERLLAERTDRRRRRRSTPAAHDRLHEHGHAIGRHDDLLAAHGRRLAEVEGKVLRLDLGPLGRPTAPPVQWTSIVGPAPGLALVADGDTLRMPQRWLA